MPSTAIVCVGDIIDTDAAEGFLRGHGTHVVDGRLHASVCGVVERINKLISVRPLKNRYSAELGDVVVGRVYEVAGKRWKIDLNARQEASLMLSAVNLPGGVQRRRTAEDELQMRSVFSEGDLISGEVQSLHHDGSCMLHTRSLKYGKLTGGQAVTVSPNIIRRQKQHFNTFEELGVSVILGCNGIVWVAPQGAAADAPAAAAPHLVQEGAMQVDGAPQQHVRRAHEAVARMANAVRALAALYLSVTPASLQETCQASITRGVPIKAMLDAPFLSIVGEAEAGRRVTAAAR